MIDLIIQIICQIKKEKLIRKELKELIRTINK